MALSLKDFRKAELITDAAGNTYIKRYAVARILLTSLPTLSTTHRKNGLKPLKRRIQRNHVYLLEDIVNYLSKRE